MKLKKLLTYINPSILTWQFLPILGTIQQLKNKLGTGFNLEMKLKSEDQVTCAQQYVQMQFPHAVEKELFGKFISYRVPPRDVQSLGRAYENLEAGMLFIIDFLLSPEFK